LGKKEMKKSRLILLLVAIASFGLIGFAVYLQVVKGMLACPLCIIQRYCFIAIGLFALVGAIGSAVKPASVLGLLAALGGIGVGARLMYVQAHPTVSCGIDPVETMLNKVFTAEWFPTLFQANGECTTPYPPVFGLSVPQGAMLWFVIFALIFVVLLLRRRLD
jgi:protein dithiol:quinone oxidoreductase